MNIEIFNIFNFYNLRIQYNLITVDMRKLILVVFTFILLAGVNVGKAQTALPYSIKVGSINSIFYFLHKTAEPFNCLEQDNLA